MSFLLSSILPKRTEATRARASACRAGRWEITTTTPLLTCGCIVHTAATCITGGNWSAHSPPSLRVTPSPASWTWRLTPYHLLRMTRSDQILYNIYVLILSIFHDFYFYFYFFLLLLTLYFMFFSPGAKAGVWRCGGLWVVPLCTVLQQ